MIMDDILHAGGQHGVLRVYIILLALRHDGFRSFGGGVVRRGAAEEALLVLHRPLRSCFTISS